MPVGIIPCGAGPQECTRRPGAANGRHTVGGGGITLGKSLHLPFLTNNPPPLNPLTF